MSKIAMITDIHFGVRNDSQFFLDRYEDFFRDTFFPTLDEYNIQNVLILGDTWDNRKLLNINTLNRTKRMFFDPLFERGIKVFMIYGNHDVFYKNTNNVNSIDFLKDEYSNITVIETYDILNFDGLKIGMISWINNENYEDSMKFIRAGGAPILCGHFEIRSFELMRGQPCKDGFDKSLFEKFESVYSGHFHVMSSDGQITYISNPFQLTWADYELKKGFRLLDTETRKLTLIENPVTIYEKITFFDDADIINFPYSAYYNKIVRVFVKSFITCNQEKLNIFLEKLNQYSYQVSVMELDAISFDNDGVGDTEEFQEKVDTKILIEQYLNKITDSLNSDIDISYLKRMVNELYSEALEEGIDE